LVLGLLLLLCFDLELVESCSGEQEEKKIWAQEGISYDGLWQEAPLILGFVKSLLYYSSKQRVDARLKIFGSPFFSFLFFSVCRRS
jgi:hypothetical protein